MVLEEARESYDEALVHEITSQTEEDLQGNVERVKAWVEQWKVRVVFELGLLQQTYIHVFPPVLPSSVPLFLTTPPFILLSFIQADCEARVKDLSEMEE